MQGTSVATGQCSKSRTSYLSTEIQWGRRFKPCVKYNNRKHAYFVDHDAFNETEEVLTHLCSAERMEEVLLEINSPKNKVLPRKTSVFQFDGVLGDRLQRRRSTVVLTEINKSMEILDTSDSEVDEESPRILITNKDNLPIPSLDYNAKNTDLDISEIKVDESNTISVSESPLRNQYETSVDEPDGNKLNSKTNSLEVIVECENENSLEKNESIISNGVDEDRLFGSVREQSPLLDENVSTSHPSPGDMTSSSFSPDSGFFGCISEIKDTAGLRKVSFAPVPNEITKEFLDVEALIRSLEEYVRENSVAS